MSLRPIFKLVAVAACVASTAAIVIAGIAVGADDGPPPAAAPAVVSLWPGSVMYRVAGDFTSAGKPVGAPLTTVRIDRPLAMMTHQVTAADYHRCVQDDACPPLAPEVVPVADRPAVKVSWRDANAYAVWLSSRTGVRYRLPTDEEWAYAAGSRFKDDAMPNFDADDPAKRWLARYDREAGEQQPTDREPRSVGSFGANENGLLDLAGNVWEWTSTCFVRRALDAAGTTIGEPTVNCGVRVAEGRHRAYVVDFIRDARGGGCGVGVPPSNLGFRLVRDEDSMLRLRALVGRLRDALGLRGAG
jgi:formylglycine-generating enzyme required for sulfatase activity